MGLGVRANGTLPAVAVIPLKGLDHAKSRLGDVLSQADRAELVCLPEKWTVLGDSEALQEGAEPLDGPSLTAARGWAGELGIHLLAGSIPERVEGQDRLSNTSVLIGPQGEDVAVYRKIHMFDVEVEGVTYRE